MRRDDERDLDLGVIGVSEGNGHPYSFSAIVNGYDDGGMAATGRDVIHDDLRQKDRSEFGFPGVAVTHAWTQDRDETKRLCQAAKIPNAVADREALIDAVDAVLLLRDDYERHHEMAMPFLEAGIPVFVDRPLAVNTAALQAFRPYLESGLLMTCSAMRFARELDEARVNLDGYGAVRLARGTVVGDWATHGVQALDAIFGMLASRPTAVTAVESAHDAVTVETDGGPLVRVDALGEATTAFDVDFYGTRSRSRHRLRDEFRAYRRALWHFLEMVRTGEPAVPPQKILDVLRTVIAGQRALQTSQRVPLEDV